MYIHGRHLRRSAALSLLAAALPSSAFIGYSGNMISTAFAASAGSSFGCSSQLRDVKNKNNYNNNNNSASSRSFFARRGGDQRSTDSDVVLRHMTSEGRAPPPPASISPFSYPVRRVAVVGGTHGNEYTGVWCIKAIERQRETYDDESSREEDDSSGENIDANDNDDGDDDDDDDDGRVNVFRKFPSLEIETLMANPVAFLQNKRFVDTDLNREFNVEKLRRVTIDESSMEECDVRNEFCSDGDGDGDADDAAEGANNPAEDDSSSLPHESVRAREIESILGLKFAGEDRPEPGTADVVIDLHTTTANMGISLIVPEGDALMAAAAAHVMKVCGEKYGEEEAKCLMHALPRRRDRMNLSSCGRHGFTIEVGPIPQGVIRHDVVEKTETALHALMEFLHLRNSELENASDGADAPSRTLDRLDEAYPGGVVPCYRSAPAVRPGELSGKIRWPSDPSNPNFPRWMVHSSAQDGDFRPLRRGDPLFVELDGTVVPYDGSHGEEVRLIFVNEGGYYYESSGTGIGVAVESRFDWRTGWFLEETGDGEVVLEEEDSYE